MIGRTVSHYRIVSQLGAGGMGVVYEALDLKLDRTVALKFLPPESTRDPQARIRFVNEARAASALDHPNICTVYEIDETEDGQSFIAMACYEGETLKDRIARGPLPLDQALDVAHRIAGGLAKAHERGIVHRDIKPANIFLTGDGMVKVLDFGLAKLSKETRVTQTGATLGTVDYMSPEQAQGGEADHRTDLWCLGAVLYEMVTGLPPFRGEEKQAVVFAILNEAPEPLTAVRTGVPMDLERLVTRCLEKDPCARYQTAGDLVSDLRRVQGRFESASQPTVALPGSARPRRRSPLAVAVVVLAAVVVCVALLVGLNAGGLRDRLAATEEMSPIRSLAVLPFTNMMGDAEQDFFVEGLHESLITEMSKLGDLRVISRTTAMHYEGSGNPLPEIARELDVDALVEGSVLRVDGRVRITAQLIRGANDEHLWAEDYDRDLQDILNLLSEVAGAIAEEIDLVLTPGQQERLASDRRVNPAVYDMVLRGQHHLNRFNYEDALEARRYFEQAVAADPRFALAHAFLSASYIVLSMVGEFPPTEVYPPARASVTRALELDPGLAGAHTALAFIKLYYDWDWTAAEREFRQALELNPNDAYALHGLADVLSVNGGFDEAVDLVRRGHQLDPFSYLRNVTLWSHLLMARRYDEAIAEVERWRTATSDPRTGWHILYASFLHQGRHEEAMAELRHSTTGLDPDSSPRLEAAYAEGGIRAAFKVCADRLATLRQEGYVDAYNIALYYAVAGDEDGTFTWLERGYEDRNSGIHTLTRPAFDPYRTDRRFEDQLRRIGIPERAWSATGGGGD
ncbi:MAG: protein kinase [bacterium]|nr:protein kinase [bacterium]